MWDKHITREYFCLEIGKPAVFYDYQVTPTMSANNAFVHHNLVFSSDVH